MRFGAKMQGLSQAWLLRVDPSKGGHKKLLAKAADKGGEAANNTKAGDAADHTEAGDAATQKLGTQLLYQLESPYGI